MITQKIHQDSAYPPASVGWRAVTIFTLLYILSYADRKLLSLLVDPIQADLQITDFQFGLLQGFAFSLFYVIAGIPLGRLVDRRPRRMIIYVGVTIWSIATAVSGFAQNFVFLFLARCGVGVGEASLSPASYSMMSDLFPKDKLSTALGVYGSGVTIGGGVAFLLGGTIIALVSGTEGIYLGWLGTLKAWQFAFLVMGLPGALLAGLIFLIPEPARTGKASKGTAGVRTAELVAFMKARSTFIFFHFIGFSMVATWAFSVSSWAPAFYGRVFGISPISMGVGLAIYTGVFGTVGTLVGGRIVDHFARRGVADAQMRVCMWAVLAAIPFGVAAFLYPSAIGSFFLLAIMQFFLMFFIGPAVGSLQIVVPNEMRGQMSAIYLFVVSLIGYGLGPIAVGAVTDFVIGDRSRVGTSLILVILTSGPLAVILLALGLAPMRRAVALAEQWAPKE